jgi:hypothetical protein
VARSEHAALQGAGLKAGADPDDVVAAGIAANAPFVSSEEYRAWIKRSIAALRNQE